MNDEERGACASHPRGRLDSLLLLHGEDGGEGQGGVDCTEGERKAKVCEGREAL